MPTSLRAHLGLQFHALRAFLLVFFVVLPAWSQAVPVVVAVDTSRSLRLAELEDVGERLAAALGELPESTPMALLAFDDTPRWVVPFPASPAEVADALATLHPAGEVTLLNDALFVATRELSGGGVILLATDGRDESSATTVDDMARRSESQGVRVVAIGTGARLEERALRRLALLTEGRYLGRIETVSESAVGEAIIMAQQETGADSERPSVRGGEVGARGEETIGAAPGRTDALDPAEWPEADRAATPKSASEGGAGMAGGLSDAPAWLVPTLAGLCGVLFLAVLFLWRRGRPGAAEAPDEDLFAALVPPSPGEASPAKVQSAVPPPPRPPRDALLSLEIQPASERAEVTGETAIFEPPPEGAIDTTRVLVERWLVEVHEPGEEARVFALEPRQAFAVGRHGDAENTLTFADPALSAHHLRLVPHEGRLFVVDIGSTNGTALRGERIDEISEVRGGDVLQAGQIELRVQREIGGLKRQVS